MERTTKMPNQWEKERNFSPSSPLLIGFQDAEIRRFHTVFKPELKTIKSNLLIVKKAFRVRESERREGEGGPDQGFVLGRGSEISPAIEIPPGHHSPFSELPLELQRILPSANTGDHSKIQLINFSIVLILNNLIDFSSFYQHICAKRVGRDRFIFSSEWWSSYYPIAFCSRIDKNLGERRSSLLCDVSGRWVSLRYDRRLSSGCDSDHAEINRRVVLQASTVLRSTWHTETNIVIQRKFFFQQIQGRVNSGPSFSIMFKYFV